MGDKRTADVLVVEPDKLLGQAYVKALYSHGLAAVWQPSAQLAINSMDSQRPRLILLEIQMPEHNGIEFLYEVRSYADLKDIPVLLLTSIPERELGLNDVIRQQLGVAGYHYKPQTSLQKLCTVVVQLLGADR